MDEATARLINSLMLEDMGENGNDPHYDPQERPVGSWYGDYEDPETSYERDVREGVSTEGWSNDYVEPPVPPEPAPWDEEQERAKDNWVTTRLLEPSDGSDSPSPDPSAWPNLAVDVGEASNSATEVGNEIADPGDDTTPRATSEAKGKGRAPTPQSDDEAGEAGSVDENDKDADGEEVQDDYDDENSEPSAKRQRLAYDDADEDDEDDILGACSRVWDHELGKDIPYFTIPWWFSARRLGIIVSQEDDHDRRSRRNDPFFEGDHNTVEVHEIYLSEPEEDEDARAANTSQKATTAMKDTLQGSDVHHAMELHTERTEKIRTEAKALRHREGAKLVGV